MPESKSYDLIIIGGGPAGYVGAIRAAQLGKNVLCIEAERAGGTCLNWGCIPSKALLKSAELYQMIQHSGDFGINCEKVDFDFSKIMSRSRNVADTMGKGIEFLFKKNKVDYIVGMAQIIVPGMVEITEGKDKGKIFSTKNILIATGCKARELPGVKVDGIRVMTSREALEMKSMPKSIIILGAGAIGAEFAYFLNAFGCKVTLVEMLPRVLPIEDEEVSEVVNKAFKKQGVEIYLRSKAENVLVSDKSVKLDAVTESGKKSSLEADALLIAIGVIANMNGLLSSKVKLDLDRGFIKVDDSYQTSIKTIYAAGDIIGAPWLAHVASYEAIQAVNGMFGKEKPSRVKNFPGCTYCQPQVASIGLTEKAAKEKDLKYKIGKFPFIASGKAIAMNHPEGFVKLIIDEKYGEILGAHIVGAEATELIAEYVLAMNTEITAQEIHHTIHAHPTLSEALMEAAAATQGEAIHI